MILLTGVVLALTVVPDPWKLPTVALFALIEAAETVFTWRWSRRGAPRVGVETLPGAVGRAASDCDPGGTVRVRGELWQARSTSPVRRGDRIRVTGRDRLTLLVEPVRSDHAPGASPGAREHGDC